MINIRKNVFETNSSSTHSICISKEPAIWGKSICFRTGEYGWESECVVDTASYLYTGILELEDSESYLSQLKKILREHNVDFEFEDPGSWYYIDHGGELYDLINDLLNDEDKLCRFLFGDSMIYTGNDNEDSDDIKMCDIAVGDYALSENGEWIFRDSPLKNEKEYEYYYKGN